MSRCWPYRCSSHWWKAVPFLAARAGGRGIGLRTCRASSAGSRASETSDDTESRAGSWTGIDPLSARRWARSASSSSASRRQASTRAWSASVKASGAGSVPASTRAAASRTAS